MLRADLTGGLEPEVQVNCDVNLLNGYRISLRRRRERHPGGERLDPRRDRSTISRTTFSVRVPGEYKAVRPIEDIVVKMQNGKPIYVRDVADVRYAFEDRKTYRPAERQGGGDAGRPQARRARISSGSPMKSKRSSRTAQPRLPGGVSIVVSNDQSITRQPHGVRAREQHHDRACSSS